MRKNRCLTEGTSYPGCQDKAVRHVPSLTTGVQRSYITTTVQLNSIKFSLGECRRCTFKNKYIRCCLAGRTSLIQTVGVLSRLQCPDHPCPGLPLAAQGLQLLVTSAPLVTTGSSAGPVTTLALFRCGQGTLPKKAFTCQDEVSSTAGSLLGQPCPSCSLAQMCCFQISITTWVNKQ